MVDLRRQIERKKADPALAAFFDLAEGEGDYAEDSDAETPDA